MLADLLWILWFFLPAGVANSAPVFANKIPGINRWSTPMDFHATFRGKRILGNHKTWRGLSVGAFAGAIVGAIQMALVNTFDLDFSAYTAFDYASTQTVLLGAAMGVGALLGDALKSFFKRQFNRPSGVSWFPFDQIDYVIGGCLAAAPFIRLGALEYAAIAITWFTVHLLASYAGYLLKLKPAAI